MHIQTVNVPARRMGQPVPGRALEIGRGVTALHFSSAMFSAKIDPLLMVDHFVMTAPTFDPHMHTGISAVTVLFEDSTGGFRNRDTLGHDFALQPGDLYWMAAARGAAHEERPEEGARTHALQVFVDLPPRLKNEPARALHVRAQDVPRLQGPDHEVRVVLGRSGDARGAEGTPEEMALLDGFLQAGGRFVHGLPAGRSAWLYAVSGALEVGFLGESRTLREGHALVVGAGAPGPIELTSQGASHFVLMAACPIHGNPAPGLQGAGTDSQSLPAGVAG